MQYANRMLLYLVGYDISTAINCCGNAVDAFYARVTCSRRLRFADLAGAAYKAMFGRWCSPLPVSVVGQKHTLRLN